MIKTLRSPDRAILSLVCAGVAAIVLAVLGGFPASAQLCTGKQINYTQTGNTSPTYGECDTLSVCQQPMLTDPVYSLDTPSCNPYLGSCAMRAQFETDFPGNHQNDPSLSGYFYSFATVELYSSGGSLVGACGVPGAVILQDLGAVTVTSGATCSNPDAGKYEVRAIMCKGKGSCQKTTTLALDFGSAAGCIVPPKEKCNGDPASSCRECLVGGVGVGGGGPGAGGSGGPGDPAAGGGAYLYYAAQGAGHPNLPGSTAWNVALGRYWSHSYAMRIVPTPDESHVWMITQYGTFREWSGLDAMTGVYGTVSPSNEYRTLTWTGTGWELEELDGTVHSFDAGGLWLSTTDRNGNSKTAVYSGGVLTQVQFPDGRREDFGYHPSGKLASIAQVGVDGTTTRTWQYTWTGDDLTRVDRPDGTAILYTYGDGRFPGYLTRIELEGTDGTSTRVERAYEYDAEGNVIATWAGDVSKTGADAVDLWQLSFDDPADPTVTTVTDPLGDPITYEIARDTVSDNVKVTSISGDCPVCGLGPNVTLSYDDSSHPLLPTSTTDGRGVTMAMSYDAHGQITSRTEAMGETEERTTTWTYDATYPGLVTTMEVPSVSGGGATRTTEWIRDGSGNPTTRRITGVEGGSAFSYDTVSTFNAAGQALTVDPPGYSTADATTWDYTPGAGEPARGGLYPFTRTDPLVGDTTYAYGPFNRRTSVTDPNGVQTTTSYDLLDRVTETVQVGANPGVDDLVTTEDYTVFGDLFRTTLPEGNLIEYGYDAAGRLISAERRPDASTHGERTLYTLGPSGNREKEELQRWDAGASAWVTESSTSYQYTSRCQAASMSRGGSITSYAYL